MTDQNVNNFYETLMKILSRKYEVNIKVKVKKAA